MKRSSGWLAAAGAGAGLAAWWALGRTKRAKLSLLGQVVLITGGSRGLGLAMAREFADAGCHLALCARDRDELERARVDLTNRGAQVLTVECDITRHDDVDRMVRLVLEKYGRIDVLVNNAGVIQVGPLENLTVKEFETAMAVIFWGNLYTTLAVLPGMRQRRAGTIVNITSIGGKISVPHLLPYSCAKFAAVALSEGLHAELAPAGINVITIVPGLMRTGSHINAEFKGDVKREYTWFSLGAATPLASISAEGAARSVLQAVQNGSAERILSVSANVAARLHGAVPELTLPILELVNKYLLPGPGESPLTRGQEARERLGSKILETATMLGTMAGRRLNESVSPSVR